MKQVIKSADMNYDDVCYDIVYYLHPTVEVTAIGTDGKTEETFYVQLSGTEHRVDCWINTFKEENISSDDYPLFDLNEIIEYAETFAEEEANPEFYNGFWLYNADGYVLVATRNDKYLNRDASPYTEDWEKVLYKADDEDEAKEWIDNYEEDDEEDKYDIGCEHKITYYYNRKHVCDSCGKIIKYEYH